MTFQTEEVLRLLRDVRRQKNNLQEIEGLLIALSGRKQKPVYVRAVEWLLAALVEKPIERFVEAILNWLEKWRLRRNP